MFSRLLFAGLLGLAGMRGVNGQCYTFSSGKAASLTVNLPNLPAMTMGHSPKRAIFPVRRMVQPARSKERSTLDPFFSSGGDRTCHPDEGAVRDQWSRNRRRYSDSSDGAR